MFAQFLKCLNFFPKLNIVFAYFFRQLLSHMEEIFTRAYDFDEEGQMDCYGRGK